MSDNLDRASTASLDSRDDVSALRLYVLRFAYLGNFLLLGLNVWPALVSPEKPIAPMNGVAFAFWAALSTFSALGLRYPLAMLPVLFMQLFYKAVWLLFVALPLWSGAQWSAGAAGLFTGMVVGVVGDLLVIPWPYVYANYVRKRGDRWRISTRGSRSPFVGFRLMKKHP